MDVSIPVALEDCDRLTLARSRELLVVTPNFTHETVERLVDVDPLLRARLDEPAAKLLGQITTLCVRC